MFYRCSCCQQNFTTIRKKREHYCRKGEKKTINERRPNNVLRNLPAGNNGKANQP